MIRALGRCAVTATALLAGIAAVAPAAGASTVPAMTLNQNAGRTAGSTANLGLDLKFTNSGTDSPKQLTINLPPGLLANAAIDGGACLRTANLSGTACQVGTGTVTAAPDVGPLNLGVPVSISVSFYLVPPPAPGDLAGLAVVGLGEQIGSTGGIRVRPSGDPDGVGVTIALVLPNQLPVVNAGQISVTEINSTFDALRYPTTCPSTPAALTATVNSYSDATLHTATAPLTVTGCSGLNYTPAFRVGAVRDGGDRQVRLTTTVTQAPTEAPSRSVSLAFPTDTLAPNLASIRALCLNLASGTCSTVGSATATSPLYPTPLTGKAYLTGSTSGLALTLVFPSPFPLTLTGAVDLVNNAATFTGLPDIPLTHLAVTLDGGAQGLFLSTCQTPTGTATATLTDQNGDKTARVPARFTVAGCPSAGGGSTGSSAGGLPIAVGGGRNGSTTQGVSLAGVTFSRGRFAGLRAGHPALSFRVRGPRLTALTVALPSGLHFLRGLHRGVIVGGARIASLGLVHGRLAITLRRPVGAVTVRIRALSESAGLHRKARRRRLKRLPLAVAVRYGSRRRTTLHVEITHLR